MGEWTSEEFKRIAVSTKLSDRTLAACHDVLVEGKSGVVAGLDHQMAPAQVSRGLRVLRDRQSELIRSAHNMKIDTNLLKYTAEQIAKNIKGEGFDIKDPQSGRRYEGVPVVNTHGFLVQQVGRSGIIHDLGRLERVPTMNNKVGIEYPAGAGQAKVEDLGPALVRRAADRGEDLGR